MSSKYKIRDQGKLYFVTFTVIQWLDVFTRQEYRDIFLDSLRYCQQNKGLEVCAYVIMTNHIHMIIGRHGAPALEDIVRDIKKYTSVKIIDAIKNNPQESRKELMLWLPACRQRQVRTRRKKEWKQYSLSILGAKLPSGRVV
jgi:REP element-mobilizing transposase RayT